MSTSYDVVILGGGNAGFGVSSIVHDAGKKLAFIEQRDFGGTCPNRGCTPKKVLVAAGHSLHEIHLAAQHGIQVGEPTLDWSKLIDREKQMIDFIPGAMLSAAEKRGDVYRGQAKFIERNAVEVNGEILNAEDFVIATGSTPRALPIPGAEHMITSDEVLSERQQPQRVVFIGGGVIAMEFSHVYARAGSQVTILEVMPQLLPRIDETAVSQLADYSSSIGIQIATSVSVDAIEAQADHFVVSYTDNGDAKTVTADRVVNGAGRVANIADLNLTTAGIESENGRIQVDAYLRSVQNPRVWVAGDALTHSPQLSPIATEEGRLVGHNIVHGPTETIDYTVIPSAVYTVPALATVGLSEQEAAETGHDIQVTVNDMREWFSGKTYAEPVAWSKVIVNKKDGQFLGAHMVGHQAEELIHLFALVMQQNMTADDLRSCRFAFPTFMSDVRNLF